MPTLRLMHVPPALMTRVRRYARAVGLEISAAGAQLLTIALDHREARARGGRAGSQAMTAEQRRARAQHAARARWARRAGPTSEEGR